MIAFKYFANNDVRKVEIDIPKPGKGEILVKVLAAGVCGTDLHIRTHGDWIGKPVMPQVTMGHEFVGEVVEIGPETEFLQKYPQVGTDIRVGSRVTAEPHIPCGKCYWCLRGQSNICGEIGHLGVSMDGAFAEYMVIPADRCSLIPDSITNLQAVGIEPLACAVRAVHRSQMTVGNTVAVIGAGPMGQDAAKTAKMTGAGLMIVSEPNPARRKLAAAQGYDLVINPEEDDLQEAVMDLTHGIGTDITFEAAGLSSTIDQAIACTRHGGHIVQAGVPTGKITIDIRRLVIGELKIIGEHATQWDFGTSIAMIQNGSVDTASLVTHTYPLNQAIEAMDTAMHSSEAVKVVLTNE